MVSSMSLLSTLNHPSSQQTPASLALNDNGTLFTASPMPPRTRNLPRQNKRRSRARDAVTNADADANAGSVPAAADDVMAHSVG